MRFRAAFSAGGAGYDNYLDESQLLIQRAKRYAALVGNYCRPGSMLDIGDQCWLLEVVVVDLFGPHAADHVSNPVELLVVDQKARIHSRRICNDAKPETGGATTIGHRLAHIDDFDPANRSV